MLLSGCIQGNKQLLQNKGSLQCALEIGRWVQIETEMYVWSLTVGECLHFRHLMTARS